MNLSSLYELRERLFACSLAGTGLVEEDFRLVRALDAIEPLRKASKVFERIGDMVQAFMDAKGVGRNGLLLDAIALTDAVLCTQGAIHVPGDFVPLTAVGRLAFEEVPYSKVGPLLTALTTVGGGRFQVIHTAMEEQGELLNDYRLHEGLIQALGDTYGEIAQLVESWMMQGGSSWIPFLQHGFDPAGKKEMIRRVSIIDNIAGAAENSWYLSMLPCAEKAIKERLILALRHTIENESVLMELFQTEKGSIRQAAMKALSYLKTESVEQFFVRQSQKKSDTYSDIVACRKDDVYGEIAAVKADLFLDQVLGLTEEGQTQEQNKQACTVLKMLHGKSNDAVLAVYRRAAAHDRELLRFKDKDKKHLMNFETSAQVQVENLKLAFLLVLTESIVCEEGGKLAALSQELYQEYGWDYAAPVFAAALIGQDAKTVFDEFTPIFKKGNQVQKKLLLSVLGMVQYQKKTKDYAIICMEQDDIQSKLIECRVPLKEKLDERWFSFLIGDKFHEICGFYYANGQSYGTFGAGKGYEFDFQILFGLMDLDSPVCVDLVGKYYYQRALASKDNRVYFPKLKIMGYSKCSGLIANYVMKNMKNQRTAVSMWTLHNMFTGLWMTNEEKASELEEIMRIIKHSETNQNVGWNIETLKEYCEKLRAGVDVFEVS